MLTNGLPTSNIDEDHRKYTEGIRAIFGRGFTALPKFTLRASEFGIFNNVISASGNNYNHFLDDHPGNDFLLDEWLSGISKVRKNSANYEFLSVFASAINLASFTTDRKLIPLQIPFATDGTERWLGASFLPTGSGLKEGRVSFGVSIPTPGTFSMGNTTTPVPLVGILVDEWIDVIPNEAETTGVAFHANQPNAKPPQCLLLGLTPQVTGNWQWNDLVDMVNETFDLAKARAVTYEMIGHTAAGHLLPTFMVPVTANNTTIGFTPFDIF